MDMTEQEWTDLIDPYLQGTIPPDAQLRLENRMAADPAFAEEVGLIRTTYQVILHEQHRRMKIKMKQWDKEWPGIEWGNIAVGVAVLMAGMMIWGFIYFTPSCLALRHFESYNETLSADPADSVSAARWENADAAFLSKDFDTAILLYADLASQVTGQGQQLAQWNMLLSRLALTGPSPHWMADFEHFSITKEASFQRKVNRLRVSLDHPLNRIFIHGLRIQTGGFNPKII